MASPAQLSAEFRKTLIHRSGFRHGNAVNRGAHAGHHLVRSLNMTTPNGKWICRSFRPNDGKPPLVPWAPPGELSVMTDVSGVNGTLNLTHLCAGPATWN